MSGRFLAEGLQPKHLLLDTRVLIHHLLGSSRIGKRAYAIVEAAATADAVLVSAITPWEIALLVSKGRVQLESDVMDWVQAALAKPGVHLVPLDPEIAVASTRLPFEMHSDPADRILVATARKLRATLVTADRALLKLAHLRHFRAVDAEK